MKIDFSDYISLTEKNILSINNIGIECITGKISFAECSSNFGECRNIEGNYVGEFDLSGSNPSIVLYTTPHTTHFFFIDDKNLFYQIIKTISGYGYEFMDTEKLSWFFSDLTCHEPLKQY